MSVRIDVTGLKRTARLAGLTESAARAAMSAAQRDADRMAQSRVRRVFKDASGLPLQASRVRVKKLRGNAGAWSGLNPVRAVDAFRGAPRAVRGGVRIGRRKFPRAFIVPRGGRPVVLERTGRGRKAVRAVELPVVGRVQPALRAAAPQLRARYYAKFDAEFTRQLARRAIR